MQSSLRPLLRQKSKHGNLTLRNRRPRPRPSRTPCLVCRFSQFTRFQAAQANQPERPTSNARSGQPARNTRSEQFPRNTRSEQPARNARSEQVSAQETQSPAQISALVTAIEQDIPLEENTPFVPPAKPYDYLCSVAEACLTIDSVHNQGQHTVSGRIDIEDIPPITATGVHQGYAQARDAMALEMLRLLHARRFLPDEAALPDKSDIGDNMSDVYNYCARFVQWPDITITETRVLPVRRGHLQGQFRCTIRFAEQNIEVSATATGNRAQLLSQDAAAILFKDAVEKRVASQGESALANDASYLNLADAQKFHDWMNGENASYKSRFLVFKDNAFGTTGHVASAVVNNRQLGPDVHAGTRPEAIARARLVGAIAMCQRNTALLPRFRNAIIAGKGEIFQRIEPLDIGVSEDSILMMQETLLKARDSGLSDSHAELEPADLSNPADSPRKYRRGGLFLTEERRDEISLDLRDKYKRYVRNPRNREALARRAELPMIQFEKEISDMIDQNIYSIIVGATGSGKTTQVPQIILQKAWAENRGGWVEVMCTQPRRIAATSVSRRMKTELGPDLADKVGFAVRHEAEPPEPGGAVTYCTTGVLLAKLQADPESFFDRYSHLIIDEVHERDQIIDFTLTSLKSAIDSRLVRGEPVPRVTLMSATIDSDLFSDYFKNRGRHGVLTTAPVLEVPGRLFPVKERYLDEMMTDLETQYSKDKLVRLRNDEASVEYLKAEQMWDRAVVPKSSSESWKNAEPAQDKDDSVVDWKGKVNSSMETDMTVESICPSGLIATAVAHIARTTSDGSILVFLPGLEELGQVKAFMDENILGVNFNDATKYRTYLLHSSIAETQTSVFEEVPKRIRKIILSTNIGETSITIPDVKHVIDSGKSREIRYDYKSRISRLMCSWISKSNAKQRMGRAGRVSEGNYYAMFTRERHASLQQVATPEILRTDLQLTCLNVANSFGRDQSIAEFLAAAIEPPLQDAVDEAVTNLKGLNALTESEKVTSLGRLLAILPIHPSLGKMIVLGVLFRCLDPIIVTCAGADERSIFNRNPEVRAQASQRKLELSAGTQSDHLAAYKAFNEIRRMELNSGVNAAWQYAQDNFLVFNSYRAIHKAGEQILNLLLQAGLAEQTPTFMRDNMTFGGTELNINSGKPHLVKAILLAGLAPNLAYKYPGPTPFWRAFNADKVMIPSTAVSHRARTKANVDTHPTNNLTTYGSLMRSNDGNSLFMRDVTVVSPLMAALFSRHLDLQDRTANLLRVDGWLPLSIHADYPRAAQTIHQFKLAMERMQIGAFADLAHRSAFTSNDTRDFLVEKIVAILDNEVDHFDREMSRTWLHTHPGSAEAQREVDHAETLQLQEMQEMEYAKDFYADSSRPDIARRRSGPGQRPQKESGYRHARVVYSRGTGQLDRMLPIARAERQQTMRQIHDVALLMNRDYRSVKQEERELEVDATAFQSPRFREHLGKVEEEIEGTKRDEDEARLDDHR